MASNTAKQSEPISSMNSTQNLVYVDESQKHSSDNEGDNITLDCSPGPAAYNVDHTTRAVYKSAPHYTFGIRHSDLRHNYSTGPGPGSYNLPCMRSHGRDAPHYSLTSRRNMYKAAPFIVQYKD